MKIELDAPLYNRFQTGLETCIYPLYVPYITCFQISWRLLLFLH